MIALLRSVEQKQKLVAKLLYEESTISLATRSRKGIPHATPLYYVFYGLHLFWLSSPSSEHSLNLRPDEEISACVYRPGENWKEICGVQMRGTAGAVTDRMLRKQVTDAYVQRFALGTVFRLAISQHTLYEFTPSWIRYIDNRRRFGYKFELAWSNESVGPER